MTARAARFGAAMAMLWAAHDLADHVVQTDHQALTKSGDWRGMAGHIGTYHLTQAAAVLALRTLGVRPGWRRVLAGMAVSAGTHAFLDRRWPVKLLLDLTGSPKFARPNLPRSGPFVLGIGDDAEWVDMPVPLHGPHLADQALHHVALTVAAAILAGGDR